MSFLKDLLIAVHVPVKILGCLTWADNANINKRKYNAVSVHDIHYMVILAMTPRIADGIKRTWTLRREKRVAVL